MVSSRIRQMLELPVLVKEMRIMLRDCKTWLISLLYLLLVCSITTGFAAELNTPDNIIDTRGISESLMECLFWLQYVLLALLTPIAACSLVSGERESNTLDLTKVSRLSTFQLVLGKLGFALAYIWLPVIAAIPVAGIIFIIGGISPGQLAWDYLVLGVNTLITALVGLCFSARESRTRNALVYTYGTVFVMQLVLIPLIINFPPWELNAPIHVAGVIFNVIYIVFFLFVRSQDYLRSQTARQRNLRVAYGLWHFFNCWWLANYLVTLGISQEAFEAQPVIWVILLLMTVATVGFCIPVTAAGKVLEPHAVHGRLGLLTWPTVVCLNMAMLTYLTAGDAPSLASICWLSFAIAGTCILSISVFSLALHFFTRRYCSFMITYAITAVSNLLLPLLRYTAADIDQLYLRLSAFDLLTFIWSDIDQTGILSNEIYVEVFGAMFVWIVAATALAVIVQLLSIRRRRLAKQAQLAAQANGKPA